MPELIIEIPTEAIPQIKAWVDSRTNEGILNNWTGAEYAAYCDRFLTNYFRSQIEQFERQVYMKSFTFIDPTVLRSSVSVYLLGSMDSISSVSAATAGTP